MQNTWDYFPIEIGARLRTEQLEELHYALWERGIDIAPPDYWAFSAKGDIARGITPYMNYLYYAGRSIISGLFNFDYWYLPHSGGVAQLACLGNTAGYQPSTGLYVKVCTPPSYGEMRDDVAAFLVGKNVPAEYTNWGGYYTATITGAWRDQNPLIFPTYYFSVNHHGNPPAAYLHLPAGPTGSPGQEISTMWVNPVWLVTKGEKVWFHYGKEFTPYDNFELRTGKIILAEHANILYRVINLMNTRGVLGDTYHNPPLFPCESIWRSKIAIWHPGQNVPLPDTFTDEWHNFGDQSASSIVIDTQDVSTSMVTFRSSHDLRMGSFRLRHFNSPNGRVEISGGILNVLKMGYMTDGTNYLPLNRSISFGIGFSGSHGVINTPGGFKSFGDTRIGGELPFQISDGVGGSVMSFSVPQNTKLPIKCAVYLTGADDWQSLPGNYYREEARAGLYTAYFTHSGAVKLKVQKCDDVDIYGLN